MRPHLTACLSGAILFGLIAASASPAIAADDDALVPPTAKELHETLRGINVPKQLGTEPAHQVATAARDKEGHAAVNLRVEFRTGSADLTPAATRVLDALGGAMAAPDLAKSRFRIEGHTDTVGTAALNQALSERRAQAVAAYLEGKFGVEAARLEPVGRGESDPVVPTQPQTPEARNRRVEVVNLGA